MKKLTFDKLNIELTRRCNMLPNCPHCFRGKPQEINIKKEYIDSLFKQTEIIGSLFFTGGEPTLCINEMEYILDRLYEYNIPLFNFGLVTNGLIYDERLIDTIKNYSKLVTMCREIGLEKENEILPSYMNITIGVSIDRFHNHELQAQNNLEKYAKALKGFAQVRKLAIGNIPRKEGKAKQFSSGLSLSGLEEAYKKRIEILDKDHKPLCPQYQTYKMIKPEQTIICCDMYLSCKGKLLRSDLGMHEYSLVDSKNCIICDVTDDIYESILRYNDGKTDCLTVTKQSIYQNMKNPLKNLADAIYMMAHQKEDDSEILIENKSLGWVNLDDFSRLAALNPSLIDVTIQQAQEQNYLKY